MKQIGICSGSGQTGSQRILKHIATASRILSDHNSATSLRVLRSLLCRLSIVPAEKTSHLISVLHRQIDICLSTKSVCSKIFSHKFCPALSVLGHRLLFRARSQSSTQALLRTRFSINTRFLSGNVQEHPAMSGVAQIHFLPALPCSYGCLPGALP